MMIFKQISPWILGSSSPRRKELLSGSGFNFTIEFPKVDETITDKELTKNYVQRISADKLKSIEQKKPNFKGLIITADTIVVCEDLILGKPKNPEEGFEFLKRLNGNTHSVITSIEFKNMVCDESFGFLTETKVRFRNFRESILRAYSQTEDPKDKAGGYSLQGPGTFLIDSIHGSFNNVIGFPVECFVGVLLEKNLLLS